MSETLETRWLQAMRGERPQQPGARVIIAKATTRDLDPVRGSAAILQTAAANSGSKTITSLNVLHTDGTQGAAFCWGVNGFGWGQGEWP